MAKTFKDKKAVYGGPIKSKQYNSEKNRSRRYDHYKRFGPVESHHEALDCYCRHCGHATEFEAGFLVCLDCGSVENATINVALESRAA